MKTNPIQKILEKQKLIIIDGAMATELESKGCNLKDELWSAKVLLENPERIREVHKDYFTAGADVATTASYQATVPGFVKKGLSEAKAKELIVNSINLAKGARDEIWEASQSGKLGNDAMNRSKPLVAASVGPYGAYLADGSEYKGNYNVSIAFLKEFHQARIKLLLSGGPDLLACETLPCLDEAKAILEVLQGLPDTYAWFSFSCKDRKHISDGTEIKTCAAYLNQFDQVAAIGVNCTAPEYIESLIGEIKFATQKPVIVYPNSGETYDPIDKVWKEGHDCMCYSDLTKVWFEAGARLIGGCCRTTPKDIESLSKWARL